MRAHGWVLWGVLCFASGACSYEGTDASRPAQVIPITPLRDWSSLAAHASDDGNRSKPGTFEKSAGDTKARKKTDGDSARRRSLYARLPKDSLLVLHVSDVSQLPDLFEASEVGRLYSESESRNAGEQLRTLIEAGTADLRSNSPEFDALLDILPSLQGEAAISVSGLTAEALAASPSRTNPAVA